MLTQLTTKQKGLLLLLALAILGALAATVLVVYRNSHAVDESTRNIFTSTPGQATYTDVNGAERSLEDYLGQVLVVTSWASWSPFTQNDFTSLNLIADDYAGRDVVFMAINRKETKDQAARYLSTISEYKNLLIVIDTEDRFYSSVAGYAMPETLVFDKTGAITLHLRGVVDAAAVRGAVDAALASE